MSWTAEGSLGFGSPVFSVTSGPCMMSDGGRCVGRAEGYGPNEGCAVAVGGTGGGVLGPCAVFDTWNGNDHVMLPGARRYHSDCPVGATLVAGDALSWASNEAYQGSVGCRGSCGDNGCAAKGTCGAPYSYDGLGGGWQLCFACNACRLMPKNSAARVRFPPCSSKHRRMTRSSKTDITSRRRP